jgi:hypothetical protein
VGVEGYKNSTPQKLVVGLKTQNLQKKTSDTSDFPKLAVTNFSQNRCHRVLKLSATEISKTSRWAGWHRTGVTGFPKPVPPGLTQGQTRRCVCVVFVSLSTHMGYLSIETLSNSLWCIPLDSTTYLYSRSNINAILELLSIFFKNSHIWSIYPHERSIHQCLIDLSTSTLS